jgi:hypothetical protein
MITSGHEQENGSRPVVFLKLEAYFQERGEPAPDPSTKTEEFIRALHRSWKEAGGAVAGKSRHSDRFLSEQLRNNNINVASLTPKLTGKTRIKAVDGAGLVRFFLSNWPQPLGADAGGDENNPDAIAYAPFLEDREIQEMADYVARHLETPSWEVPVNSIPVIRPTITELARDKPYSTVPGLDITELLEARFREADAVFTVATETAVVSAGRGTSLIGFRNLMNAWKDIDEAEDKPRPLIWILEYGVRKFEDEAARMRYVNCQNLIMRLKALRSFNDRDSTARWEWLKSRALFLVYDPLSDEDLNMRGVKRPIFSTQHVCLSGSAPNWITSPDFRTLYGSELERYDQRNFSVFFRAHGWIKESERWVLGEPRHQQEDVTLVHRRYFGFASFSQDPKGPESTQSRVGRGLELPIPEAGGSYGRAFRAVYAASCDFLGLENRSTEGREAAEDDAVLGRDAIKQLKYLGFRFLKAEEFLQL